MREKRYFKRFLGFLNSWFGLVHSEVHVQSHSSFFTNSWIKEWLFQHSCLESLHDRDPQSWLDAYMRREAPLSWKMILT